MASVLIVDDHQPSRIALSTCLADSGHQVLQAGSGERALELASDGLPDVVVLDVGLPGINGFETTRLLKDLAGEEYLPIVIVSGLADPTARMLALRSGADTFLTKPVAFDELLCRIDHLAALHAGNKSLRRAAMDLRNRDHLKDDLIAMLVHDLKNPISAAIANLDYAVEDLPPGSPLANPIADARGAVKRTLRLLTNLIDVTRMESSCLRAERTSCVLSQLIHPIVREREMLARETGILIAIGEQTSPTLHIDSDMFTRVLENIFDNAMRYTPRGGRIEVAFSDESERVQIRVGNTGKPIPVEHREAIFEKFRQLSSREIGRMNAGLGLYFCRLAVESHGGRIWVEERDPLGTIFVIELPRTIGSAASASSRAAA